MVTATRCGRCGGTQYHSTDLYGDYMACLQCGGTRDINAAGTLEEILDRLMRTSSSLQIGRQRRRKA